jgi:hypothetical protein
MLPPLIVGFSHVQLGGGAALATGTSYTLRQMLLLEVLWSCWLLGQGVGMSVLVVFFLYNPIFLTLHLSYDHNKLWEYIIRPGHLFQLGKSCLSIRVLSFSMKLVGVTV